MVWITTVEIVHQPAFQDKFLPSDRAQDLLLYGLLIYKLLPLLIARASLERPPLQLQPANLMKRSEQDWKHNSRDEFE